MQETIEKLNAAYTPLAQAEALLHEAGNDSIAELVARAAGAVDAHASALSWAAEQD
ncbi:MAG: hypothetical protein ACREDO_11905 [Methyloceanibacter sp.]